MNYKSWLQSSTGFPMCERLGKAKDFQQLFYIEMFHQVGHLDYSYSQPKKASVHWSQMQLLQPSSPASQLRVPPEITTSQMSLTS